MKSLVYLNGEFLEGKEAKVPALDLSVLRGFGVMDYFRTYGGVPFRLREHIERFFGSAECISLTIPHTFGELEEITKALVEKAPFDEMGVKLVLTGGSSPDQLMPGGGEIFFATAYPFIPFPREYYEKGIKVTTGLYARPFPEAKSINYLAAIVALKEGEKKGAVDVLFYDEKGRILETATANFFAIQKGRIITPKSGILRGITRRVIFELCDVEEKDILLEEIATFEGAFLTSSNKEVMPVIQIDHHLINGGKIPPIIRQLMADFSSATKNLLQNI
ncbi:MAG: aminotransferase class IV [Chlamydiia bacterium]|nr:aminotransferase class IV [Chlamydiia bacterium]